MGRTERLHTHWLPTGPSVATTTRSRFSVMIRATRAPHGWCITTAPRRVAAPHLAVGGGVVRSEDTFRASNRHQQAHHRAACPFEAAGHFSCKSLSGSRHRGGSQGGGRRNAWAGAEVLRPSVCTHASSPVRIARRTCTYRCPRRLVAHRHECMITMLELA
jgi:hypothetical protein